MYLFLGLPGYHNHFCSLSVVVKIKHIEAYRFIFYFLASPADEFCNNAIMHLCFNNENLRIRFFHVYSINVHNYIVTLIE